MPHKRANTATNSGREAGIAGARDRRIAHAYIGLMVLLGALVLTTALGDWNTEDEVRFLTFFTSTLVASVLKVRLPGITGTMSVNFLFILMAFPKLSLGETVVMAGAGGALQYVWHSRKKLRVMQAAFNVSSISLSAWCAWNVHHWDYLREIGLESLPILCISASTYFFVNTLTVAIVIALTERKLISRTWKHWFRWTFPYYVASAVIIGAMDYLGTLLGWQTTLMTLPFVYTIYRSYQFYLGRLESEKKHAEEMAALHLRTIEALALAIEAKDDTTNAHLHRVQVYARELGKELGLTESEQSALQAASLLHDIGKLAVPEHIISKPGRLTPEEFEKMKIHPVVGAEILERVQFPYPVVPIVATHHEKWDGTGYPHGLSGEQIPIGARILSAVDCLDALASDRQYRRALPLDQAMAMVKEQSGKAFDPRVVETLERRYTALEALARSEFVETPRLSKDIQIAPGVAPAAGFEEQPETPLSASHRNSDFITCIAAARTEVQTLFDLSQALGSSLSLTDTLCVLAQRLQSIIPYSGLSFWLLRNGVLQPEYVTGHDAELFRSLSIPAGQGLSGWVAETGKPIVNGNPSVEPGYTNDPARFSTLRSAIAVPLEGAGGRIGVISLYHRDAHAFTQDHLRILLAISSKLGLAIENSLRFRAAERSTTTDGLTGLPNVRTLFAHLENEIAKREEDGHAMTLLVCDLDDFKTINDSFGHTEGNRLLTRVATAVKTHCRETDYVARLGGDEFVVVLHGVDETAGEATAERISHAVAQTGTQDHPKACCNLTVGVAMWRTGMRAEELVGEADRRMYAAKRSRKDGRDSGKVITLPCSRPRAVSA